MIFEKAIRNTIICLKKLKLNVAISKQFSTTIKREILRNCFISGYDQNLPWSSLAVCYFQLSHIFGELRNDQIFLIENFTGFNFYMRIKPGAAGCDQMVANSLKVLIVNFYFLQSSEGMTISDEQFFILMNRYVQVKSAEKLSMKF